MTILVSQTSTRQPRILNLLTTLLTPKDWKQRELHPELDSWTTVSTINAGLTEFGQTVCDVVKQDYIEWESEFDPPEDLPDF